MNSTPEADSGASPSNPSPACGGEGARGTLILPAGGGAKAPAGFENLGAEDDVAAPSPLGGGGGGGGGGTELIDSSYMKSRNEGESTRLCHFYPSLWLGVFTKQVGDLARVGALQAASLLL